MELPERNLVPSRLEAALRRAEDMERAAAAAPPPVVQPVARDEDELYDSSLFVENDHVSMVSREFGRNYGKPEQFALREPAPLRTPETEHFPVDEDGREVLESLSLEFPKMPIPDARDYSVACHWAGPMFDYGGYARMNRTYIFLLKNRGALVRTEPCTTIENVNRRTLEALMQMNVADVPSNYPKVFGMTIPDLVSHGGRKILYTMMETSLKVHPEYAERLNLADEIWVPCQWNVETFRESGVVPPIYVMPLGVDTERYRPGVEPLEFNGNLRGFRFLSVFGWSYRKGFDVLLRAYLEEFSSRDDVTLILSTRFHGNIEETSHRRILKDFQYCRGLVAKSDDELPHITLHSAYTPEERMPQLYNSAHCFVLPSRGEGFGLPYVEAAACGLPVIASNHGGQRDFLDDEVAYLVDPDGYFVSRRQDPPFKNMAWISHFYEDQSFPEYGRQAHEQLKAHMRDVYENYHMAQAKARKLRGRIVERYDWLHSVERVYRRLEEICKGIVPEPTKRLRGLR